MSFTRGMLEWRPRRGGARLAPFLGVGLLAAAAAGCGGTNAPAVANIPTTTTSAAAATTTTIRPGQVALADCFTQHGFPPSSAPSSNGKTLSIAGLDFDGVDPGSSQFQAAVQACRKYLPGGGPKALSPAQQAEATRAMTSFASCMRRNGVPGFPDPNSSGFFPATSLGGLDPNSPIFQSAFTTCEPLEPKVGPRIEFATGGSSASRG